MSDKPNREVPVTFAEGVRDDVMSLVASSTADERIDGSEVEALKHRIAELLVECKANPCIGEPLSQLWTGKTALLANRTVAQTTTGLTGRSSKQAPCWQRIRELHAQRFDG